MDGLSLAAALTSALLHAGWNAAVKAQAAPREAMAAQMIAAALLAAAGLLATGLPAAATWPWVVLSTLLNVCAVQSLLCAYEHGGFGTVYPVMRAIGVLVVAALAPLAFGEMLSRTAWIGVGLVVAALLALTLDARGPGGTEGPDAPDTPPHDFPPRALAWTALAGVFTGGYVLSDAQGVRASAAPMAYGLCVSVTNALAMSWVMRGVGSPWALVARHWRLALPSSIVSMISYLLILWVFMRAPIAPAAALRDTSAVFAMLIAVLWLKERLQPRRLIALALAVAGVPLLRLG